MKGARIKQKANKATNGTARRASSTGSTVSKKVSIRKKAAVINDRYEMRIDSARRAMWERAKVLSGFSTLKDYLTHLADLDAEKVIEKHEKMTLTNDVFDMFIEACEKANKPNDALLSASKMAKEQGF